MDDPYELRIYTGDKTKGDMCWEVMEATVTEADRQAGVSVKVIQEQGLSRIVFLVPANRTINWSVRFRKLQ